MNRSLEAGDRRLFAVLEPESDPKNDVQEASSKNNQDVVDSMWEVVELEIVIRQDSISYCCLSKRKAFQN